MGKVGRPKKNVGKMKQINLVLPEDLYWDIKSLVVKKRESLVDFFANAARKEINKEKRRKSKFENGEHWSI
jgi:hypothetical protein